jgi:hypothetical protein
MTKQYQIQEYVNRNVFKFDNVWQCIDLRNGDTFHCETRQEAINIFVSIWDLLTPNQKKLA